MWREGCTNEEKCWWLIHLTIYFWFQNQSGMYFYMIYPQKWKPNNEGYNRNHPPAQNAMPADLFGVECQQNCFGEEGQWESIVGKEPSSFVWGEKGCRQYVNKYVAGMESGQSSGYAIYSCVITCHVWSRITANKGSKLYVRCYFLNWCWWLYVNLLKLA